MCWPPLQERLSELEGRARRFDRPVALDAHERAGLEALVAEVDTLLGELACVGADPEVRVSPPTPLGTTRLRLNEARRRLASATEGDARIVALDLACGEGRRALAFVRAYVQGRDAGPDTASVALALRRLFARFRRQLAQRPSAACVESSLDEAAHAIEVLRADDAFAHARIADRLQLLELQLRLVRRADGPRRLEDGLTIHGALQALATSLLGINERDVLRRHDARLALALLDELRTDLDATLASAALRLRALEGREEALDQLLAEPLDARELLRRARPLLERLAAELQAELDAT